MSLDTTTSGLATATAPIRQIVDGTPLGVRGRAECRAPLCHQSLREGSPCVLVLHRMSDEARWSASGVACDDCTAETTARFRGTGGVEEAIVAGRLVTRTDAARQQATLVFRSGEDRSDVLEYSDVGDGAQP